MKPERRTAKRLKPSELTYLEFGEGIGGMVWDASEKGLAFQAIDGLQAGCTLRLSISPNPACRIELSGKVVWTDLSKKFGGLQFAALPEHTRESICAWLAPDTAPPIGEQEIAPPVMQREKSVGIRSNEERKTDNIPPVLEGSCDAGPMRAPILTSAASSRASFSSPIFVPELFQAEGALVAPRSFRSYAIAIALLTVAVLASSIVVFPNLRAASGAALIRLGEKLKGNRRVQAAGSSSSPVGISGPTAPVRPPQPSLNGVSPSNGFPEEPAAAGQAQEALGASGSETFRQTHFLKQGQNAKTIGKIRFRAHRSALAAQLWSSIGAGDVTAEIALAQLYLAGDGVPRSCEQARVLLKAASSSGDPNAKRQLHNLKKRGCR